LRFAAIAFVALILSGTAWGDPTVFISPAQLTVDVGEPFEMSIRVDDGFPDPISGFRVDFSFDAGVIELASAEEGSLFADSGHGTMFHWDVLGPGEHSCNDVTLGHSCHVLPPGELVSLDFVALLEGDTPVTITFADLRDTNRDPILPVCTADGCVTVMPETGIADAPIDALAELEIRASPNPSRGPVEIEFPVDRADVSAAISVHDVSGRIVARPRSSGVWDGAGAVTWDGRSDVGEALPSGVYFVVVRTGDTARRAKCVLLR
jgi:hypothetical protein